MCQIISLINNRSASGKTFVSTYLGMTLATMGEKVFEHLAMEMIILKKQNNEN